MKELSSSGSWFADAMRGSAAGLGGTHLKVHDLLRALPLQAVRNNLVAGLGHASSRGRPLWNHQAETLAAFAAHLADPARDPRALAVIPTAGGKTEIIVRLVEATGLDAGGARLAVPTIVLEPSRHLIRQTVETFRERFPALQVSGLLAPDDRPRGVTVMSYELFVNMLRDGRLLPGDVGAVVMDEAHRGLSDLRQDLIRRFLDHAVVTAFSATPAFDANKTVHALLGAENEVIKIADERLRREGIISPVANYVLRVDVVGALPDDPALRRAILRKAGHEALIGFLATYEEPATGLRLRDKAFFGYANGIRQAEGLAAAMTAAGMPARGVKGSEGLEALKANLLDLRDGHLRALVNDKVLLEGVNLPQARGVVAFDATSSLVKHVQRCGRARRLDPALDRFDPRQMSSVVEAMVCIDGMPLDTQRIYAEAIGDLSVARVYDTPRRDAAALAREIVRDRPAEAAGEEDRDDASEMDEAIGRLEDDRWSGAKVAGPRAPVDAERWADAFSVMGSLDGIHYLLAEREGPRRLEGMLHRVQVARAIGIRTDDPHLKDLFGELEEAARAGLTPEVAGVAVHAGFHRFERQRAFYVHVDDVPRVGVEVFRRSGRTLAAGTMPDNFGAERRAGWLTRTEAAFACNLNPYHPAFTAVWDAALAGTLGAFEGGPLIRLLRDGGKPKLHVHERGLEVFRRHLGVQGPTLPAKRADQASVWEVMRALGVSKRLTRFREQWDRMVEDCMRDGQVVRDGRRVGFGFVRGANGSPVPALDRAEIAWFAQLIGVAGLIEPSEEWLTINEAGRAISTSPYATPALKDLWMEIRRSYEETGVGRAAGREWRGAMAKGTEVGAFRLHRSEMDALAAAIGRGRDRLMTDEWLSAKKVAALLNQNPDRGRFREVWDGLLECLEAGEPPVLDGVALRMEARLLCGKPVPCLHVSEVDALGRMTGGRRSAGPKGDAWQGMADAAGHFGKHPTDPTFRRSWQALVVAAEDGPVLDGARAVRFEYRTATKAVWCLNRDELEWFGKRTWPKRRPPVPRPYVPLADLRAGEAVEGALDAFDLVAEEVDGLLADASPMSLLGREGLRFERLPEGGLAVHPDDVAGFLDSVRELSETASSP
ncbi:DNA or RNA helicases of superfamily II (plasmid) [Methylobacterium aquaticum]|uniref:DNA or RNA helicases of superfamily II n=1 Tax=Methylobacterium aquaticum TaxID=270351 RepID=A0A0C6FQJ4_9HYPH|nr:DNA or RNA helicases of superfamily II [Methylobacterium aquaticum]